MEWCGCGTDVAVTAVAFFLVGDVATGDAEEEDVGEDADARMRPARGVFLARQGDGRLSGSAALSGDVARGEAGAEADATAEATPDADDAADNGEPATAAAAVSATSPSAMLEV
jgi:hypothetical protein